MVAAARTASRPVKGQEGDPLWFLSASARPTGARPAHAGAHARESEHRAATGSCAGPAVLVWREQLGCQQNFQPVVFHLKNTFTSFTGPPVPT